MTTFGDIAFASSLPRAADISSRRCMSESTILHSRLAVMVRLRQPLPIHRIPEQIHVSLMRNDVINNLSWIQTPLMLTKPIDSDRMRNQISLTGFLPLRAIPALRGIGPVFLTDPTRHAGCTESPLYKVHAARPVRTYLFRHLEPSTNRVRNRRRPIEHADLPARVQIRMHSVLHITGCRAQMLRRIGRVL